MAWHKVLVAAILLLLIVIFVVVALSFRGANIRPRLYMSPDNAVENGGQISILDLASGSFSDLRFEADGCDGVALDATNHKVRIACRMGAASYADYDERSHALSTSTPPFPQQPTFHSPLVCTKTGKCYYGFGYAQIGGDSGGRIMVTKNGVLEKTIKIPESMGNMSPVRFEIFGDTLWVLERGGAGTEALVRRFDLRREEFMLKPIHIGKDAVDIAANGDIVAVSTIPDATCNKILFFSAATGLPFKDHSVLAGEPSSYVFGLAINGDVLYTAGSAGVSAYSLQTFLRLQNHPTPDFAFDIAYGNEAIYATIPNSGRIEELDPTTLLLRRVFTKPVGFGNIIVIEGN